MKTKYALYKYSTENVGDEIQSIAARRFLPQVDYYIDRDMVGEWRNRHQDEEVKLIANGWYMRSPFAWPPTDQTLKPLLISMYVEPNSVDGKKVPREVFLTPESRHYLAQYGPIGARDKTTLNFFRDNNIEAYFSGCVTLTLQREEKLPRCDYILAIDIPDELYDYLKGHTKRRIIRLSPYGDFEMAGTDRFAVAEYFLVLYQMAHAIVTTRLHAMLPALALETPVLLIKQPGMYDPQRYAGLDNLARSATTQEYMTDYSLFDLDKPKQNPMDYLTIRRDLIKRCSDYTGYDTTNSFLTIDLPNFYKNESLIAVFADSFMKRLKVLQDKYEINGLETEQKRLLGESERLKQELATAKKELNYREQQLVELQKNYNDLKSDYKHIRKTSLGYAVKVVKSRLRH